MDAGFRRKYDQRKDRSLSNAPKRKAIWRLRSSIRACYNRAERHAAANGGERIAKVIARAGLCSRREAEAWIAAGRVAVNGAVISSPALNVTAQDRITVDGKPLPQRERTRLFLYHKPRGLVTTQRRPAGPADHLRARCRSICRG